ncbi:hypothetical protein SAMN04488527_13029 [Aliiroseovarius crassostreae]|uniref:Uncharacterized protein n=1 Tax=Aliiroseovarius crassostreae TaxID=154981 RepID=A0A0N8IBF2_9RHOB|nr:hypothetical protein [Aliiroseovarius crassostreae]KPN62939.1 hypothetical protein AKJ29_01985 [Aliiroseovarius crassostreae]SFU89624.1 hypothetical protein SAMN04488527_13029 [Aliiroseovarius crassostreae]
MRAVLIPFDLARKATSWAVTSPTEQDICATVFCAQIIRGFDGRKDMDPEHYFVGKDVTQISLDEVFTVRSEDAVPEQRKGAHLSLFNEIRSAEFSALLTHLVHDAMVTEDVALIFPDAVSFEYGDPATFIAANSVSLRLDADLNPLGEPVSPDRFTVFGMGELLLLDHVLQVWDDIPDCAAPNEDICGSDFGKVLTARVVTQGHEEGERTVSLFEVTVLENEVQISMTEKPEIVPTEQAVGGDEDIVLVPSEFREDGQVVTTDGEVLNPLLGLAKNNLAGQDEQQENGGGDDSSGQTTQQSNELD